MQYSAVMILETRAVPPFYKNGFLVGCEDTREGIVIDPGDEVQELLDLVERHNLSIKYILLTHAHLDHITGVGRAKAALAAPVWLHRDDNFLYERIVQQGLAFGFPVEKQPDVDSFYDGEGPLRFGRYEVTVRHTPGHCPGGVCLAVRREGEQESVLFVGDTLFAGLIRRTSKTNRNQVHAKPRRIALKSVPIAARCSRLAQIVVDDMDALPRPAEQDGSLDQAILQFRTLLMVANLARRGLTHIDIGELGTVRRRDPLFRERRRGQHDVPPLLGATPAAGGLQAGRPAAPVAVASPSGVGPTGGAIPSASRSRSPCDDRAGGRSSSGAPVGSSWWEASTART